MTLPSEEWMRGLSGRCHRARCAMEAVLGYQAKLAGEELAIFDPRISAKEGGPEGSVEVSAHLFHPRAKRPMVFFVTLDAGFFDSTPPRLMDIFQRVAPDPCWVDGKMLRACGCGQLFKVDISDDAPAEFVEHNGQRHRCEVHQ